VIINVNSNHNRLINGLRGLAVLLVLSYHFNLPLFGNGYWGVDLFFWISGFLITRGFLREYSANREINGIFGWLDLRYFYLRRARRILPLASIVLLMISTANYFFGSTQALNQTLRRIPAILTFSLNLQLQNESQNYFLSSSQDYGLLHYWSLSLEEQIYVLAPLMFIIAVSFNGLRILRLRTRWYHRVALMYSILTILSFLFMVQQNHSHQVSNYYSTFSRYWEFGLGSILAVLIHLKVEKKFNYQLGIYLSQLSSTIFIGTFFIPHNYDLGPLVGIPLIAISIFVLFNFNQKRRLFFTKIIEFQILQLFGKIAFPLYLIHWPLLILLRDLRSHYSLLDALFYLCFVILASLLLHNYLEAPILKVNLESFRRDFTNLSSRKLNQRLMNTRLVGLLLSTVMATLIILIGHHSQAIKTTGKVEKYFSTSRYGTASPSDGIDIPKTGQPDGALGLLSKGSSSEDTTKKTALTDDKEVVAKKNVLPPEKLLAKEVFSPDKNWTNQLYQAVNSRSIPSNYKFNQTKVWNELHKSWNSGCLDSQSSESACVYGNGNKEAILVGDSFAFALLDGLKSALGSNWKLRVLTRGGCLPWDLTQYSPSGVENVACSEHSNWVNTYISTSHPDLVIASGADQWIQNTNIQTWKAGYLSSVDFFKKNANRLLIVSSAPGSGDLNKCVEKGDSLRACFGYANTVLKFASIQNHYSTINNYDYINLLDYLCVQGSCPAIIQGTPVYADGSHLSKVFVQKIAPLFNSLHLFD
jgi:peptidoglycan/LPS O-acetylase OafA/YrhL